MMPLLLKCCKQHQDPTETLTRLTSWLVEKEVAHNVFLCPGQENQPARVLVWPRESVLGAKDPGAFAMAVCELSGQVQPSEYRLTIYRYAIIVSFSKYRKNIDIAFFLKISHNI